MKRFTGMLSAALSLLLLFSFAACNTGGEGDRDPEYEYGRYVEEDITPPNMKGAPLTYYTGSNGTIDIITSLYDEAIYNSRYYRYRSTDDGKSWETVDMSWTEEYIIDYSPYWGRDVDEYTYPDEEIGLNGMTLLENGDVVFMLSRYSNITYDSTTEFMRVNERGEEQDVNLELMQEIASVNAQDGKRLSISDFTLLPGNKILVTAYYQTYNARDDYYSWDKDIRNVYDLESGKKLYSLDGFEGYNYLYNDTTLFIENYSSSYTAVNLADGTELDVPLPTYEQMYQLNMYAYSGNTFVDEDYNFFTVSDKGMRKVNTEQEKAELVMDGLNYSYGSPRVYISSINCDNDGNFILSVSENESDIVKLLRYTWDPDAIASTGETLQVFSMYDNELIRLALYEFKVAHPEVTVSFEYARERYTWDENAEVLTEEDVLRQLNIELLNGTGPDVLILDDLPLQSYVEKGILEDVSATVQNVNLIDSVFQPFYDGGKLYAVPTKFSVPLLFGEEEYIKGFTSFEDIIGAVKDNATITQYSDDDYMNMTEEDWARIDKEYRTYKTPEERPAFNYSSLDAATMELFEICGPAIFTEQTGINRENLASFMEAMKAISDHYDLSKNNYVQTAADSYVLQYGNTLNYGASGIWNLTSQRTRLALTQLYSFNVLNDAGHSMLNMQYNYGSWDDEGNFVEPDFEIPKETYDAILAPGLSEGTYMPVSIIGVCSTSTNKELAFDFIQAALAENVQRYAGWGGNGLPVSREAFEYLKTEYYKGDEYLKEQGVEPMELDFDGLVDSVNTPYFTNSYLLHIIYNNLVPYCEERATLEQAVNEIVSQTELYFAERQ